jgi:hypothetical protein
MKFRKDWFRHLEDDGRDTRTKSQRTRRFHKPNFIFHNKESTLKIYVFNETIYSKGLWVHLVYIQQITSDYATGSGKAETGLHTPSPRQAGPLTCNILSHKNPFLLQGNKMFR